MGTWPSCPGVAERGQAQAEACVPRGPPAALRACVGPEGVRRCLLFLLAHRFPCQAVCNRGKEEGGRAAWESSEGKSGVFTTPWGYWDGRCFQSYLAGSPGRLRSSVYEDSWEGLFLLTGGRGNGSGAHRCFVEKGSPPTTVLRSRTFCQGGHGR